jgi:hypothetical protein
MQNNVAVRRRTIILFMRRVEPNITKSLRANCALLYDMKNCENGIKSRRKKASGKQNDILIGRESNWMSWFYCWVYEG